MSKNIKPCPFCGNEHNLIQSDDIYRGHKNENKFTSYYVSCEECNLTIGRGEPDEYGDRSNNFKSEDEAINFWNSRDESQSELPKFYYRYGKCSNKELTEYLNRIHIVKKKDDKYYLPTDELISNYKKGLRKYSINFDWKFSDKYFDNLEEITTITYLVKSSSRFFLKPDLGEIFDQIPFQYLYGNSNLFAICINNGADLLNGTDGEHFLMTATLLKQK